MSFHSNSSNTPLIICNNLVKIYTIAEHEVVALQGLDLIVNTSEILGIIGPSGSGKSTLMNILGGLDRPSAGHIWVGGRDLLKLSNIALDRYRRINVGFVWQQSGRNLLPYLNALNNVVLPMTISMQTGSQKRRWAEELLDAVGLTDRSHSRISELSGGEQQRVAIAVALANKPKILLADEPTGEVDSENALIIYQIFRDLNNEYGLTTLIVSHDPGLTRHVDRIVAIRDGKTASEIVRQTLEKAPLKTITNDFKADKVEIGYEELTLLDSAGRLQIPKEYLEQLNIRGRVRVELSEDSIIIRPAPDVDTIQAAEELVTKLEDVKEQSSLRRLLGGWRRVFKALIKK
jgi:ABC-type lipoprotein export system ATPase subunit/bifunctional DNA-binding transcriptional regulator/antitoxin component of YhaV-PrlF toxin-antitoxin module